MRIAVLGATGRTGRLVVGEARARGHEVLALARDANKAYEILGGFGDGVRVVSGDLRDAAALDGLVGGTGEGPVDAVVSCAGPAPGSSGEVLPGAARHTIAAMRTHGVRRLVWLTGAGVARPGDTPKVLDRVAATVIRLTDRVTFQGSHDAVAEIAATDDLDWTVVRAPRLTDGRTTGSTRIADRVGGGHGTQLARGDLARVLVDLAEKDDRRHASPVVSN
jgi:putative NADH-flavin reductase